MMKIKMFAIGLAVLAGCRQQAPPAFERPPAPVSVVSAVSQDVPVYLDEVGKAAAREVVSVQPQVSGSITEIHFTDGAHLKKGALLFTIDPRPYRAQLAAAEANRAEAKAALELARIQLDRAASLIQTKAIAQQEYDTRKNAVDVAAARVEQSDAAVQTARLNLDYCFIRSPIEGRAGERLVDRGNVVTTNTGSLLVIQRLDPIYADFTITEHDLTAVQRNLANGSLKVEVRLPDQPADPRVGMLTFVDNAVQGGTGTVKLRATISNGDHRFWPGRFVKIRLVLDTIEQAVLVPAAAPQTNALGPFVYVVKDDSTAEQRTVTPGQRQGDLVVISQGLKAGEQVVVNGQLGVTPGGKVRVEKAATALSQASIKKTEGKS
ncbi:MAG TPA: efflux RND transporter periplasmic adaptor subunit [Thermoanaerobaculia bacterium]|nr:efflux RND transporter periplasmic adaptor subunit [Thermoanaerobaculia bacterium]